MPQQRLNRTTTTTQQPLVGWCEQCEGEVVMVTPEYAVAVLRLPPDKLFGMLASGKLHSLEKPSRILICCGSESLASAKNVNPKRVGGEAAQGQQPLDKLQEAKREKRNLP
jgi:hypothetical protein